MEPLTLALIYRIMTTLIKILKTASRPLDTYKLWCFTKNFKFIFLMLMEFLIELGPVCSSLWKSSVVTNKLLCRPWGKDWSRGQKLKEMFRDQLVPKLSPFFSIQQTLRPIEVRGISPNVWPRVDKILVQ